MVKTIVPFATAVLTCSMSAQLPERPPRILEEKPGLVTVFDDDGGRVETFRAGDPPRDIEFHGGAVIREPLAHVVFLGEWSHFAAERAALRQRIEKLPVVELEAAGVRHPLALAGTRDVDAGSRVNDLQIQAALASVALRDENVIYVVFVAPATYATVGGHDDFDSYHSNFHADDVHVRYVVAPFDGDVKAAGDAAAKSLVRAIINPDGDGWY